LSNSYRMPMARLRSLQYMRPRLLRQSEDCLYLNLFVPSRVRRGRRGGGGGGGGGKYTF
jgi:hypothetical protein